MALLIQSRAVIIGGGICGYSTAYHLARLGQPRFFTGTGFATRGGDGIATNMPPGMDATLVGATSIYATRADDLSNARFGHRVKLPLGLGYVRQAAGVDEAYMRDGRLEVAMPRAPAGAFAGAMCPHDAETAGRLVVRDPGRRH